MNDTKVFEATPVLKTQADSYNTFGIKTEEYWELQAAALRAKLDATGIESVSAEDAQIAAAAPELLAGRSEKESASIIATMRALPSHS